MAEVRHIKNVTVISLDERYESLDEPHLDAARAMLLKEADGDTPRLVCDMSRTVYVGSAFIEVLFRTWQRVRSREGSMAICGLRDFCREVVMASKLDEVWDLYDTRAEAVTALAKR